MGYVFNGTAKTITLTTGTITLNLVDLYSRWKDWVYSGNAGFLSAFLTVGGDIPAIPLYLFSLNGWTIIPQAADHVLTVTLGILEVQGGGDPFIDPIGAYKIRINRETPGIAIGYSTLGAPVITGDVTTVLTAINTVPDTVWNHTIAGDLVANVEVIKQVETGRWKIAGNQMVFYSSDGITPVLTFALKDENGAPTMNNPVERLPI